jgi:prophage tail gpP-like protein
MGPELVSVIAGGMRWTAWERVLVRASFQEGARSFRIEAAAEAGGAATAAIFGKGQQIDIDFNADLAVRGYVDRYQPRMEEHKRASISISGRGKSQDMIDCSAVHDTGHFANQTVLDIARALDKFGVGVSSDEKLTKIPIWRITPGESAFRAIEKICREQNLFCVGQPDGSLKITKGGKERHTGGLIEGVNIKVGEADFNYAGRHSDIIVRGQRPYGHGADALEIEARARDAEVGRYRPVIIHHDNDTDKERAAKRATTRRDREAGNSLKSNITTPGFHDDGGKLWTPGALVFVDSPFLNLAQDMAIETVTFSQIRNEGSLSVLSLVDPRALGGKSTKGGTAGGEWGSGAGE